MQGRTKADCTGRNKDGTKNNHALILCFIYRRMDKARKKKKLCDTIYWGFLMVSAAIAVWGNVNEVRQDRWKRKYKA